MPSVSRRAVLRGAGSAAAVGLAGCASHRSAEPRYTLTARYVGGSLADAFRWEPRGRFPDADRELMERLVAEGSLTTEGFALYPAGRDEPRYVERDGIYYRLSIERAGEVERERWVLWFDLLDGEPPGDAEVFTSSLGTGRGTDLAAEYGLSELDVRTVEDAAGEIPTEFELRDLEDAPPGRRGHVFVRRSADDTDLLPEPPFTHVAFETGDGTRYARAVAERATVALRQYRHAAEPVAETPAVYAEHVRETHVRATFDPEALPEAQRDLLDRVTPDVRLSDGQGEDGQKDSVGGGEQEDGEPEGRAVEPGREHEERPPLSDAFEAVLERLGLFGVETPEPGRVAFSDEVYFGYRGAYFRAQLQVFG